MNVFTAYYGDVFLHGSKWYNRFCILPHRCIATGKWLMPFSKAMKGIRRIDIGHSLHTFKEVHWMTHQEFTFNKLKGLL